MHSFTWSSPNPEQKFGPKRFACVWDTELDVIGMLDLMAAALVEINAGQLWRQDGRLIQRREAGPDVWELPASCSYGAAPRQGRLILEAVVQTPINQRNELGLILTFVDRPDFLGPPWMEQLSELITAQTVVHVRRSIGLQLYGYLDNENPCKYWSYLNGSWGSGSGAFFTFNGWQITLG
jgi:hypothetical protein